MTTLPINKKKEFEQSRTQSCKKTEVGKQNMID